MSAARAVVRFRVPIALAWLAAALLLLPRAGALTKRLDTTSRIAGSESALVDDELQARFASPFAHYAALVINGLPSPETPEGRAALQRVNDELMAQPDITSTLSYLQTRDTLFVGGDRTGTYVVAGLDFAARSADSVVVELRTVASELANKLATENSKPTLRWTGTEFLRYDLQQASSTDARRAEFRALPLTLLLLLAAFGAVVASLLPITFGVLAIGLASGLALYVVEYVQLSIMLQSVVSLLGLALGIDYGLIMVSRFRESLAAGQSVAKAAEEAARRGGGAVLLSGCAVAVGFAALIMVPVPELRSVAIGGLLVVTVAVLLATTLMPGLLALLGRRVDSLRIWRAPVGHAPSEMWRSWGRWVTRHPLLVLGATGFPMLLLAWPLLRLNSEAPSVDWLPRGHDSAEAVRELRAMKRGSLLDAVRVLLVLPPGTNAFDSIGWNATVQLTRSLHADTRIARVRSLPELARGVKAAGPALTTLLPASARRVFASTDEQVVFLEAIPRNDLPAKAMVSFVRELRTADVTALTGISGTRLMLGGLPAFQADFEDIITGQFGRVALLVLSGTFIALLVGFRSVLIPIKALLLNVLTVGAAYGALVLVFQDGWGSSLFGLTQPLDGVFPAIPILVFCTVFGLSMDYEVFLLVRVAEARRSGLSESEAIAEGMAQSGRLITGAAAIMIAVFAAFAFADYLPAKLLGFALAVAVLIDATIVRLAIGPALLTLAGRWNWWPGSRS